MIGIFNEPHWRVHCFPYNFGCGFPVMEGDDSKAHKFGLIDCISHDDSGHWVFHRKGTSTTSEVLKGLVDDSPMFIRITSDEDASKFRMNYVPIKNESSYILGSLKIYFSGKYIHVDYKDNNGKEATKDITYSNIQTNLMLILEPNYIRLFCTDKSFNDDEDFESHMSEYFLNRQDTTPSWTECKYDYPSMD